MNPVPSIRRVRARIRCRRLPVKSSGVLLERGARALGLHPQPCADGDQLADLQRPARLPALRLLPVLHVRVPIEVDVDGHDAAAGGSDGPLRDPAGQLRGARRDRTRRPRDRRHLLRQRRSGCSCSAPRPSILCANGAETPRLLLNSASSRFPNGLANSSGVVGKYLMFNTYFGVNAQFEHPLNEFKSVQNTRMVLDFYDTDPRRGFYGGGGIDARFGKYPITFALGGLPPGSPTGAKGSPASLAEQFPRTMFFGAHGTSLPLETNNITHRSDAQGRVGAAVHAGHLQGSSRRFEECASIPGRARPWRSRRRPGPCKAWPEPVAPQTQSVHLLGTCRMGNDPRTSVIDKYNRTHDVRNLFICDGSSLVTSSRGQPTETISALAFRAGEHIAAFARKGEI